jgi:tryptophanyl-tRNA synthetase
MSTSTNAEENNNEMVVTPWEVKGKVDYQRLIKDFGTQPLTPELLARVEKHTDKMHLQLERQIFLAKTYTSF